MVPTFIRASYCKPAVCMALNSHGLVLKSVVLCVILIFKIQCDEMILVWQ